MKKTLLLKAGDILIREGEESESMYFLKTGLLGVYKMKGSNEIQISTVHSGELIGEMSFVDKEPRSATVKAITDCEIQMINTELLNKYFDGMPNWHKILLKNLVTRLRQSNQKLKAS